MKSILIGQELVKLGSHPQADSSFFAIPSLERPNGLSCPIFIHFLPAASQLWRNASTEYNKSGAP
jgi:hypothetical protein